MVGLTDIQEVNIRPEVSILSILKSVNYKPWYAIAEFVDNAIQSAIASYDQLRAIEGDGYKLRVDIEIDSSEGHEKIVIRDNAGGINRVDFQRAFRPASIPLDRSGLSEFGMGMKSAACWFADYWTVRTSAIGENIERTITFDVKQIVEEQKEKLSIQNRSAQTNTHFTEITLTQINQLPQTKTITKIKSHLASMYRIFQREQFLELTYNGELITFNEPLILHAPSYKSPGGPIIEWKKTIDIEIATGKRITGFAGIFEKGSTTHAGFALLRRNRVIMGSDDEPYRPREIFGTTNRFASQRIFGELHLDGFEVSHTKDGIQWNHLEEKILKALKEVINSEPLPLLTQAEKHRMRPTGNDAEKTPSKVSNQSNINGSNSIPLPPSLIPRPFSQPDSSPKSTPNPDKTSLFSLNTPQKPITNLPTSTELQEIKLHDLQINHEPIHKIANDRTESFQIIFGEFTWTVNVEITRDPAIGEWLTITGLDDDKHEVDIRLAFEHPFITTFCSNANDVKDFIIRFASCLVMAEIASRNTGVKQAGSIRKHLNQFLRDGFVED